METKQKKEIPVIEVQDVCKYYRQKGGIGLGRTERIIKACDHVSFQIGAGETFGLVGESGCGKSTTGKMILRLEEVTSGKVFFRGEEITGLKKREMKNLRRKIQIIFQNPYSSLNPQKNVEQLIAEGVIAQKIFRKKSPELREYVYQIMDDCGLRRELAQYYVRSLSGGQRQRICIARALALNPDFIVCDEPVSALDVSIQAQIINLLEDLKEKRNISYLFISHDLSVVRHISDRIGVMRNGRLVELAEKEELFGNPQHEYTRMLISSVLVPDPKQRMKLSVEEMETAERVTEEGEWAKINDSHWILQE